MLFLSLFLLSSVSYSSEKTIEKDMIDSVVDKKIISYFQWIPDNINCLVVEGGKNDEYRQYIMFNSGVKELYKHNSFLYYLYSIPLSENNLLTVWETGSAYSSIIFHYDGSMIKESLSIGSDEPPEIVDINNDGKYELFFSKEKVFLKDKLSFENSTRCSLYNGEYKTDFTKSWVSRFSK